jgi:23S rRNA (uracil1939-C5)-methyltransferase
MSQQKPPVVPGQVIQLKIEGQSHTGDGIGRVNGFAVFVPQAVAGERVEAKVTKVKKTYAHARLQKVIEESPDRAQAPCEVYEACGGCQLQHLSYPAQLRMKRQQVIDSFQRIGGLSDVEVLPVIGMKEPWAYRNKAQVPFGWQKGQVVGGFYAPQSHRIVDIDMCLIQHPDNDRVVSVVKKMARELGIPPYQEKSHRGCLRHVMARIGVHTGELMVVLVTNGRDIPHRKALVEQLRQAFPNLRSVIQNIHTRRTNVILGKENRVLWGQPVIHDYIGPVKFAISPHSFFQVNPVQTEVLYEQVRRYAALTGKETIVDAYCGIGTIGLYLAGHAAKIYGVESVPEAVEDARHNAEMNGIDHTVFETGAAEEVMPRWLKEGIRPDVIIVDPPRKGCAPELLDAAVEMGPRRLVYVSCNPSTLARDAKYLAEKGYITHEVQPVDMFPHTSHVECVTAFEEA